MRIHCKLEWSVSNNPLKLMRTPPVRLPGRVCSGRLLVNFPRSAARLAAGLLVVIALSTTACNRDPNYAKKQYVESGNKYFDRGRYKEALIMYRKALSKDPEVRRSLLPARPHLPGHGTER